MKTLHTLAMVAVFVSLLPSNARAGGLYLSDRGTRALGRGGAFVAGADDGQSLWYNPAGLAYAGRKHLLIDANLPLLRASFQRVTRDDINGQPPKVEADPVWLPVPTLALADSLGLRDFSFGVGVMAPTAVTLRWPETVGTLPDGTPRPSPTRHALISNVGSAIAHVAAAAAYSGIDGLSIAAGVHVIPSRFRAGVYLSACDYGVLCQQAEQTDYEAAALIDMKLAIAVTPTFGLIYELGMLRIGASLLLFYDVKGKAAFQAQLPNAPLFGPSDECGTSEERSDNPHCARIRGDEAEVKFSMPMIARFGVELRPGNALRLEAAVVYEGWSRQKDLSITPRDIRIENALGIPEYRVGPVRTPRDMRDVWSLRLGGELSIPDTPFTLRSGATLERSAIPTRTLTPLTLDSDKLTIAVGSSISLSKDIHVDLLYAHVFMANTKVRDSIVLPHNPLRPPYQPAAGDPVAAPEPVGNGNYAMEADLLGVGLRVQL